MRVVVEPEAREDILRIREILSDRGPTASARWTAQLVSKLKTLQRFPLAGRVVPEFADDQLREVVLDNYRLWYRVADDHVRVLAVWDARRGSLPANTGESVEPYVCRFSPPQWVGVAR